VLVSSGLVLYVLESLVPTPMPWVRLGAANIITIITLYLFGFADAALVTLLRIVLGSLLRGTLFSPVFLLALGSGIAALCCMGLMRRISGRWFSPIGVSIWGALAFNCAQLVIAYAVIVGRPEVFSLLPLLLMVTPLTGFLTGSVAVMALRRSGWRKALAV